MFKSKLYLRDSQERSLIAAMHAPRLLRLYPKDYALGVMNKITDAKVGDLVTVFSRHGSSLVRIERYPKAVLDFGKYYFFNEEEECVQIRVVRLFNSSEHSAFSQERVLHSADTEYLISCSPGRLQEYLDLMVNGSYKDGSPCPELKKLVRDTLRLKNIVRYPKIQLQQR